jgi:hypothetical protein
LRSPFWLVLTVSLTVSTATKADSTVSSTNTFFHEAGGPLNMTVLTPSVDASLDLGETVGIHANWEADIVSGASVSVVDAPGATVDAVSTATQLDDVRHTFGGGFTLNGEFTSFTASYAYGTESDYRSHSIALSARTELFERNTAFDLSYARGIDKVCTLAQPRAQEAVDRQRMTSSEGCFGGEDRADEDLSLQTFQGSWTQAWTPVLSTQLTLTAQLLDGFQGNPYRSVWLGRSAALENHPRIRARYAATTGVRLWIRPLKGALQVSTRLYRDTWDIRSFTGELAYEQALFEGLRLRARGRYYTQTAAIFFSDDYSRFPVGEYFTGDRELSAMSSVTVGGRLRWDVPAGEDGYVLGFLDTLNLVGKVDLIFQDFAEFKYGGADVPNTEALIATAGIEAGF